MEAPRRYEPWSRLRSFPFDLTPLLLVALSIFALRPLLGTEYLAAHDAFAHLYRLYALDQALRQGILFPRWFPDFVFGYGYPILNFYAPLSYYLAEVVHLAGLGFLAAVKTTLALGLVASGLGMYLFARDLYGRRMAGFLSALAYMYLPYALYDLYGRVALADSLSLSFIPFLLWALRRWMRTLSLPYLSLASIALAALLLTHNLVALTFLPLLTLYGLWLAISLDSAGLGLMLRRLLALFLTGALALGLSAFFTLPALLELPFTIIGLQRQGIPEFLEQLRSPAQLVQTSLAFNYNEFFMGVGLVQALLALLALPILLRHGGPLRREALFFFAAVILYLFLTSVFSRGLWATFPLATLIAFYWRLLVNVGVGTAVLAGSLVQIESPRLRWGLLLGAVPVIIFSSIARLEPVQLDLTEAVVDASWFARYENNSAFIGTTVPTQFLPIWVKESSEKISKPGRGAYPLEGGAIPASVDLDSYEPLSIDLRTQGERRGRLLFHQFYFPGWQAYLDGVKTPIYPEGELGLIAVDVPEGAHRVQLRFEDTPIRAWSEALSLASLLLALLLLLPPGARPTKVKALPLFLGGLILVYLLGYGSNRFLASSPRSPIQPVQADLGAQVRLLGWRTDQSGVESKGLLRVSLYWYVLDTPTEDYTLSLRLVSQDGAILVATKEKGPLYGVSPTSRWRRGEIVADQQTLLLSPNLSPGPYCLEVGLFQEDRRLWLQGKDGRLLPLGCLGLRGAPPPWPSYAIQNPRRLNLGNQTSFLGYDLKGGSQGRIRQAKPGMRLEVTLYWEALRDLEEDYSIFLHFFDAAENNLVQRDSYPPEDMRFTSAWEKGQMIRDRYSLLIPPDAPPGLYWLSTGMYLLSTMERLPLLTQEGRIVGNRIILEPVKVLASSQAPPRIEQEVGAIFGGRIALLGFSPALGQTPALRPGDKLPITLYWRAVSEMEADYTIFLHLVDTQGRLWAQQDGQPRHGRYPTSFWDTGEWVEDPRQIALPLDIPPGEYRLEAGAYLLSTGERLPLEGGKDSLLLGALRVVAPG